jgi:hypothetical protein
MSLNFDNKTTLTDLHGDNILKFIAEKINKSKLESIEIIESIDWEYLKNKLMEDSKDAA